MVDLDPEVRARVVACALDARIDLDHLGRLVPSWSNHAVMVDGPVPSVLRVCWIGDTRRLTSESLLMDELPAEVGTPVVLEHGRTGNLTWAVTRRLDGCVLAEAWDSLDDGQRRDAARATAVALEAMYAHRPSAEVTGILLDLPRGEDLVGGGILAWPTSRLRAMLDAPACTLPADLRHDVWAAVSRNQSLVPEVDQAQLPVIHGDLHLHNIWWDGSRVTGLIDLEWARFAEPWTDLGRTHEKVLAETAEGGGPHVQFVGDLVDALPAWQVDERRRAMSTVGYLVRQALLWEPLTADSPPDHAVHLTRQVLGEL